MTLLTPHFTDTEFEWSETAQRLGLDNKMPREARECAVELCQHVLEPVRSVVGPIHVNSGYRAPIVNWYVRHPSRPLPQALPDGGQHPLGQAADIYALNAPLAAVWAAVLAWTKFDQMIHEFGWIHVSYGPRMRTQPLVAFHDATGQIAYREPHADEFTV